MSSFNFKEVATRYCSVNQSAIAAMPIEEQVAFFEGILALEGMGAENSAYAPDPDFIFMEKVEQVNATKEALEADSSVYSKACEDYYNFLATMDFGRFLSLCKGGDRDIDRKAIERSFEVEKTLEGWRV